MFDEFPKKVILKDGSGCDLKIADGTERDDLVDFFRRVSPDDLWCMNRDYTRVESVDMLLAQMNLAENVHVLACQEGRLMGIASLYFSRFGARKDIGEVEVIVDESFKKKRLGTWLILELQNIAISLGLELLKIELMAGKDDPVITSSKRLNFTPQATIKSYLKDMSGRYIDVVILTKEIHGHWGYH